MKLIFALLLASIARSCAFVPGALKGKVLPFVKGSRLPRSDDIGITIDYDKLFHQIKEVSPLAKVVMENGSKEHRSLNALESVPSGPLKWKTVEKRKGGSGPVKHIEKLESYNGIKAPLLRFRAEIEGPCVGDYFGKYILDLNARKKWDSQIENVYELHGFDDLDPVNIAMGFGRQYGDVTRMGIGYGKTKPGIVTPREQMFLYGMQEFPDGSCVLWGSEMDEEYNFLLPPGTRHTRAKSHLFSATLVPTSPNSFDIEYVVQMEVGGGVPVFLTTPVLIDTVKKLLKTADAEFSGREGDLESFLAEIKAEKEVVAETLLMTP